MIRCIVLPNRNSEENASRIGEFKTSYQMHPGFPPTFLSAIIWLLSSGVPSCGSKKRWNGGARAPAIITCSAHNVLFKSTETFIRSLPRFLLMSEHLELDHGCALKPTNDRKVWDHRDKFRSIQICLVLKEGRGTDHQNQNRALQIWKRRKTGRCLWARASSIPRRCAEKNWLKIKPRLGFSPRTISCNVLRLFFRHVLLPKLSRRVYAKLSWCHNLPAKFYLFSDGL